MAVCGAKTRGGTPCNKLPTKGAKRCRLHGGKSTGPKIIPYGNTSAVNPSGLYSQYLTTEEQALYIAIELGAVDHELRLTRIRLGRALAAEQTADGQPELEERTENDGGGMAIPRETRRLKVRDYSALIDKLTARIESLEKTRKTLDDTAGGNQVDGFDVVEYDDPPQI